ncbi:MAG: DUF1360 domain-containing protein [Acidimicrobiales bacterium]
MDGQEQGLGDAVEGLRERVEHEEQEHTQGKERPLGGYLVLLSTYFTMVLTLGLVVRGKRKLPSRPAAADLALVAVATHKVSRMLAKDSVLAAVRMPFTRFEGPAGAGEVNESVRGGGVRHAVGELLTCPFCLAQWVATGFTFGLLLAPRATRQVASVFCAVTASDYLQLAYCAAEKKVE